MFSLLTKKTISNILRSVIRLSFLVCSSYVQAFSNGVVDYGTPQDYAPPSGSSVTCTSNSGSVLVTINWSAACAFNFPQTAIGASSSLSFAIANQSISESVSIFTIWASGPFTVGHNCPGTLLAGEQCGGSIVFSPNVAGMAYGEFRVDLSAAGSPERKTLIGNAVSIAPTSNCAGALEFSAGSLAIVGYPKGIGEITLRNPNSCPASGLQLNLVSGGSFHISSTTCESTLAPGGTCAVRITFSTIPGYQLTDELRASAASLPLVSAQLIGTSYAPSNSIPLGP